MQTLVLRDKPVNILVTGKTGAGKSSLVNAITGNVNADEGKGLKGVTRLVKKYSLQINGVDFNIWDSPGFQDITESDAAIANKITSQLKKECTDIHLLLYCIRMDKDRIESNDQLAIMQLTDCFGPEIWKTSVFALTFANKVTPPPKMDTDERAPIYFEDRLAEYKREFIKILERCHMNAEDAAEIAVIPIGYHTTLRSCPKPYILPDREDWFNPFWITCADRMKETALAPLLLSQRDRIKLIETRELQPTQNIAADQPITEPVIFSNQYCSLLCRLLIIYLLLQSNKREIKVEKEKNISLFKKIISALKKLGGSFVHGVIKLSDAI